MRSIAIDGYTNIAYEDLNIASTRTVLLVHGWPLDSRMFEYQKEALVAAGFRVFAIDLRGFGESSITARGYNYDVFADDLYAFITAFGLRDIVLVGFSMGAAVAIRYMARHCGHAVCKLVLIAAAAPCFVRRPGEAAGKSAAEVDTLIDGLQTDRPYTVKEFDRTFFHTDVSQAFRDWFDGIAVSQEGHATVQAAKILRDADLTADLACIQVPTGIFHGRHDVICPYEMALELQANIRCSKLFTFENSGHGVFYDELGLFNRTLIGYLNACEICLPLSPCDCACSGASACRGNCTCRGECTCGNMNPDRGCGLT